MTTEVPTGWKTTSGLLDDFDIDVNEAFFGTNPKFKDRDGNLITLLHLRGPASQEDENGEMTVVDEEQTLLYGTGPGWEIQEGGQSVAKAGSDNFSNQSSIGRLVDAVIALGPEVAVQITGRGHPREAATWEGTRWHMQRKPFEFKDRNSGQMNKYEVVLPTAYLGLVEEAAPAKAGGKKATAGTKKAAPAAKAAPAPKKKAAPAASDNGLRAAIVSWANEYEFEDHGQFVNTVLNADYFPRADELREDEELSDEVLNPDSELVTSIVGS